MSPSQVVCEELIDGTRDQTNMEEVKDCNKKYRVEPGFETAACDTTKQTRSDVMYSTDLTSVNASPE